MSGFIVMDRDALEHPLLRDGARFRAWFWMLARACWKPTRFDVGGRIITLERGQFCCSVRELAEAWGWSKSAVDRFLTRLKTETMIGTDAGTGRLVITICNYAKYQDVSDEAGTANGTQTGTAAGQQRDLKEQGNKETSIIGEEAKASPPRRAKASPKFAMTPDWVPAPLPPHIAELVAHWPPGRLHRETEDFRAYWLERGDKRPGWDRSFHSRISDIHERILRDSRNGQPHNIRNTASGDRRSAIAAALDRRLGSDEPAGQVERYDAGPGEGDRGRPIARIADMR